MSKLFTSDGWSVFITSSETKKCVYTGWGPTDKYLWRMNYGKYNFTYIMWAENSCWNMGGGGGSAEFGQSIQTNDRDKIKQILNDSILYRGDNIDGASEYIKTKLYDSFKSTWMAIIVSPTTSFGYYECRLKQYWASLKSFGEFKWYYFMARRA